MMQQDIRHTSKISQAPIIIDFELLITIKGNVRKTELSSLVERSGESKDRMDLERVFTKDN